LNPKIKSGSGAAFVAMILVTGVLAISSSSHVQLADAKNDKGKYDNLRESTRKEAEATPGIIKRGDLDIVGSNTNTSSAIGIAGADGISELGADGTNGTDGADSTSISEMGAEGTNRTDEADSTSISEMGADGDSTPDMGGYAS
jgi:hypothetical protein